MSIESMVINGRNIGPDYPPLIVAELSGNHNRSLDRALELVEAAAKAGSHAIKLQTYTADTMTLDLAEGDFVVNDPKSLWKGYTLYQLYKEAHTPWDWHGPIFDRCKDLGLICFSTPFDETAVDFLEDLDVPCYKIASFENIDLPLIKTAASTGKPLIISTGMASIAELDEAVSAAREEGCKDIILLKCTSSYPSTPEDCNLLTIPHMKDLFQCQVGLSDHTLGIGVAVGAVALGATIIEKHFTLKRSDGGIDSAFSIEPEEMKSLVSETKSAWEALGKINYGLTEKEQASKVFRRSIYASKDIKTGEILTKDNIKIIRPGFGLPPKYYNILMGKQVNRDIKRGTPLDWNLLD
jgi:pseudaminic acid synthase